MELTSYIQPWEAPYEIRFPGEGGNGNCPCHLAVTYFDVIPGMPRLSFANFISIFIILDVIWKILV